MTKVMICSCRPHFYQDRQYGVGMRVFNRTRASEGKVWRCSVCGQEKSVGESLDTKKGKKK